MQNQKNNKILIVVKNFQIGGIQKASILFINQVAREFPVDVFAFSNSGPLLSQIDSKVRILPPNRFFEIFGDSQNEILKKYGMAWFLIRFLLALHSKIWTFKLAMRIACKKNHLSENYNIAISYVQGNNPNSLSSSGTSFFVLNCVNSLRKIQFIHDDMQPRQVKNALFINSYSNFDAIFVLSNQIKETVSAFCKNRIFVTSNLYDTSIIESDWTAQTNLSNEEPHFLVLARLSKEKAIPRLINAISKVVLVNLTPFHLDIYGSGPERGEIESLISAYSLKTRITLHNEILKPAKIIRNSDYLFVTSFDEARPVVIDEAHLCGTRVFCTKYSSSSEQLYKDDICVENSENGIIKGFDCLLTNYSRYKKTASKALFDDKNEQIFDNFLQNLEQIMNKR